MRVLHALHGPPDARAGGTGAYVGALVSAQRAAGDAVAVIAPGVGPLPHRAPPQGFHLGWRRPLLGALLGAMMDWYKPDVVHVHHLSGLPLDLPKRARRAGARVVWTWHDYHLPCARGQLISAEGARCPGPAPARCAACLGLRGLRDPAPAVHARLHAAQEAAAAAHVRLSPSVDLARRVAALGFGAAEPCPLPLVRPIRPAPDPGPGPVRFLCLGAQIPTKGVALLAHAFAALPPGAARLTVAGPRPDWPLDPHWDADLDGIPGLERTGAVPEAEVEALLHAHDVIVVPSLWPENSPLVLREATAAGLRAVVADHGGAPELDPEARRFRPGSVEDLTSALAAALRRGRGRRAPLAWPGADAHARWLRDGPYRR